MDRGKQLEFCKKCINKEFNMQEGLLCGLTKKKADFEDECNDFEFDHSKAELEVANKKTKKKGKIAYGFSPKQSEDMPVHDLTKKQAFVIAFKAVKSLKWNVGFLSNSGFIAFTKISMISWSEEVKIQIEVGNIKVKSECTGSQIMDWGKNRKNIDLFETAFKAIQANSNEIDFENEYEEIASEFANPEEDIISAPLSKKETISGFFSLFKPTESYFITPIIVNINIIIFLLMVITGVHFILPSNEGLLLWGANFRPSTLEGEWWRLFTSTFIHIGVFHLLMNMYALIYIGLLLEPYLGRSRFLSAYLLSGIAGSAASLYWHELTISAGASGAIFGMYGVFLAMLSTNLIEKSARKPLLISIAVFVGYNLLNGMKGGIDNAAHFGGLISGIIIGFIFYPSLKKTDHRTKLIAIAIVSLMISAGTFWVLNTTSSDIGKYDQDMLAFSRLEEKALGLYNLHQSSSDDILLEEIKNNGIPAWKEALKVLEKTQEYELPTFVDDRNKKLEEYCNLRILNYETIYKAINEKTDIYDDLLDQHSRDIELIISELTNTN
jgi:rhomboid protease GluP